MAMKEKVLVTGGSGMLGKQLKKIAPDWIYLSSKDCNLTDYSSVDNLLSKYRPDRIIHLAAKVGGILQNINYPADFFDENVVMNTNILIASKKYNVPRLTAILSTCMYPESVKSYPMTEMQLHEGPPPLSNFSYGYAKRCLAVQIDSYRSQHDLKYNYLIPCNLYGENDDFENYEKSHFVTALIKKINDAEKTNTSEILLLGTGKPLRQFMYSGDFADIIIKMVDLDVTDSFNVAPVEQNYSIDEIARTALKVLGKKDWKIEYDSTKPDGQFRKDVSCEKMYECLDKISFTSLEDGILKVYRSLYGS